MSCDYVEHYVEMAYEQCYDELGREPTPQEIDDMFEALVLEAEARFSCYETGEEDE